jgi:putative SOS response-associated peptidase YedK
MCNLYRLTTNVEAIRRLFAVTGASRFANLPDFPEIFPNRDAPVIRASANGERELAIMRWGFPAPQAAARPVTNVRNLASPFWRTALSRPDRRCLVPVTAFCEWEGETGSKRKVWFAMSDGEPFAFAGVWRPTPKGDRMAFLTCEPNATVAAVHPKAMPVVLAPDHYGQWLGDPYASVCALAVPHPEWRLVRVGEPVADR